MRIDKEKAIKFVLKAMMNKQGYKKSFKNFLSDNGLLIKEVEKPEDKIEVRSNVHLYDKEIKELERFYTKDDIDSIYDRLSHYKLSNGKTYKSDYGAINTWVIDSTIGHKKKIEINKHVKHWNE